VVRNLEEIKEFWRETSETEWQPVTGSSVIGLAAFVIFIIRQHYFTVDRWVLLLDNANLAIHEAGHPIIGLFSNRLMVYGGTIFQLLFPLIFAGHFWRERHSLGWSICLAWFGENLLNVGRYMADARAHELPLVGGGEHDWTEIFSRWGVLAADIRIGGTVRTIGFCVMLYALFWLWSRWLKTYKPVQRSSRR
jgi:hypothetical protein